MIDDLKDGLYFLPLGGSEQFGVNLNAYITGGKIFVVDCGLGFADERFPGIDLLLPDPAFLEDHKEAIVGMFITHAHEDHIGAVAHLWSRLQCPLYASRFTANILERKLLDNDVRKADVHVQAMDKAFKLGPFSITPVPVAHSIPDACALVIEAAGTRALHSGDWNLDPAPVVGERTEEKRFAAIGKQGIDVYIGDSTNAGVAGRAGSESEVADGLADVMGKMGGRVFVTTFSSNIGRLVSIARAAEKSGRSVCIVGRSMHRMWGAAIECGLVPSDVPDFVDETDLDHIPDDQLLIICTGSQGEGRAALSRISRGDHPVVQSKPGDAVIFSARTIPGNEVAINEIINNFIASGVRVITPRDTKKTIHVSGHPCRDEILDLWGWIKPKAVLPVHGERAQLEAHAKLAAEAQINDVIVPSNGALIKLTGGLEVIDHVPTGVLAVDQKRIIQAHHPSIVQRRKLQYTGTAFVSIALNEKGKIVSQPELETIGLIDDRCDDDMKLEDDLYDHVLDVLDDMRKSDRRDDDIVSEHVRIAVRRFCNKALGLRPKTIVHVLRVS